MLCTNGTSIRNDIQETTIPTAALTVITVCKIETCPVTIVSPLKESLITSTENLAHIMKGIVKTCHVPNSDVDDIAFIDAEDGENVDLMNR